MPVKAGQIVIDITAGTSKFVQDMEVAKGKIREFGEAGVSETKATRAAFKVLEGDIANNSRAAEQFAEKFLGIGKLAAVAFPVIGAAALIGTLVEGGRKVKDFFDGIAELPGKISGAFRGIALPLQATNDELQVANDRLANDIAKLEGKPTNNLKLMLDQAVESAYKLADSLDKVLGDIGKVVKENSVGGWKGFFGKTATSDDLDARFGPGGSFSVEIDKITDDGTAAIRRATDAKSKDAAQQKLNNELLGAYKAEIYDTGKILDEAASRQKTHDREKNVTDFFATPDQSARIAELHGIISQLRLAQSGIGLQDTNSRLTGQKDALSGGAEERKKGLETVNRLSKELADARAAQADAMDRILIEENNELSALTEANQLTDENVAKVREIYDTKRVTESNRLLAQYSKSIEELTKHFDTLAAASRKSFSEMWGADIKEGVKNLEDGAKAVTEWAKQYNKITAARDSESLRHNVAMAGENGNPADPLGTLANQQAIERLDIETRYEEKLKNAASDRERSIALGEKELALQKLQNEMEERTAAARHKSLADFMVEMQGDSKTLGDVLYDGAHSALDKVSDQFSKLITGQKTSFGAMFKSIGEDMTKESVKGIFQKGLGALGNKLGIHAKDGKRSTGNPDDPIYVVIKENVMSSNPLAGMSPSLPAALSSSGVLKGIGGFIQKIFGVGGGGMSTSSITYAASGADSTLPGHVYGVAEAGEAEVVSPPGGSRITPLSKLKGGGEVHYHIDARGADLGARNRVARAIEAAHGSAVQDSVRANAEHSRRVPRRKR